MKILIITFVFSGVYFLVNISVYHGTNGVTFNGVTPTPNRTFQRIKFDYINRGSFNISECIKELMTCWENMRPDIICSYGKHKDSICAVLKEQCNDVYGYIDTSWYEYTLFESVCQSDYFQEWTK